VIVLDFVPVLLYYLPVSFQKWSMLDFARRKLMKWLPAYILLGCLFACGTATASPILTIDSPTSYESGTPFDITIALIRAVDISLYTIELELSAPAGLAGVDFFFSNAAEPFDRYVFGDPASDGFAYSILDDSKHRITLSDLLISGGVTTVDEVNDLIAYVTVMTTSAMIEDITITVVSDTLELDSPDESDIDEFDELQSALPVSSVSIPEPASVLLFASVLVLLNRRSKRVD
jgi:hypothetical protein